MHTLTPPPLENGDRLTRAEFERRYTAMAHVKKAELIAGRVYMASPLRIRQHGNPHSRIITWLGVYEAATPGVMAADNATVRLDGENEPQPDALLRREGGTSRISVDDYLEGPPELIVEIAASTASYDLHEKFQVYRENGVQEYLVWRVQDGGLDWYQLRGGEYVSQDEEEGVLKSLVFPGLWLNRRALLAGDLAAVLATVQAGIATAEHQQFCQQLARS
ncbi:Uma2 family endonuclease [Spirulina sp. CCNP1310]|uniref:Uma2 family endonuclease n=1 Tax=Spirulina sp. CCNP1310 TaxID=3110249 RepID=UPI002B211939|nr:Uma2 family endonuclease [Spirulina sp. CCNP1310]MEA5417640.1 Uma2 family endonuclease [Spirulina sp. CCNP1310]